MALVTDIFEQNGWGLIEFDEQVVERVDHKPNFLSSLNLFEPVYSRSRNIAIADRNRTLTLIPTSELGSPPEELIPKGAKVRVFPATRLAKGSTIYAAELAGVTALPFEQQTIDIADEVADRSAMIYDDIDLTWEHMMFGAVQGKVLDADGTPIIDWFDEWEIAEAAEVNFALDVEGTDVRKICRDIKRAMQRAAKGVWSSRTRVYSLCGDSFFDLLVNHPQVKETKIGTDRAAELENIEGYSAITVESITFVNYRGTDDDTTIAIGSEKARFFPVGARGAFKVGWAPASEFKPGLNKRGKPVYGLLLSDTSGRDEWDRVEMYSYPLFVATRPEMLLRGKAK